MTKHKKILVTGGTGLLGKALEEIAPKNYTVINVHQRDYTVEDPKAKHLVLDIRDKRAMDRLFEKHKFDTVIHAAGIASVDYVHSHYAESLESNLVGTLNVTSACRRHDCYVVYISTNAVFDGKKAPYSEDAAVNPVNKYGQIKVECERLIKETLQRFAIARPILMYGWNHVVGRPNPATWIIEKLRRGETIQMVNDVYENPLYNIQCAEAIWAMVKQKPSGIFHLAGADTVNRYEFAQEVAKVFGLDASLIKDVDSSFFPSIAQRPPNTSFVTKRMQKELGVKPLTLHAGLTHMKQHMKIKL